MSYSRRELYAMGEPFGESATRKEGGRIIYGGGGGGPTNSTVTQSNVPDYLRPQVENVLLGAGRQLFQTKKVDSGQKDEAGNIIYNEDITGTKPFVPYSSDPSKYVAGFSPLQQQVQYNAANLMVPGQFNQATGFANAAGQGGLESAAQAAGYGNAGFQSGQMGQSLGIQGGARFGQMGAQAGNRGEGIGAFAGQDALNRANMATGMAQQAGMQGQQSGLQGQQIGILGGQYYGSMGSNFGSQGALAGSNAGLRAQANANNLTNNAYGYGDMGSNFGSQGALAGANAALLAQANANNLTNNAYGYGDMGVGYGQQGAGLGTLQGNYYGGQGAGFGSQAAALAPQAQVYGQSAADIGRMGLRAETLGQDITGQARNYAAQQAAAGQDYARQMTDPFAIQQYMSPYQSAVTDVQIEGAQRQANIARTQRGSQAARAGAFGGARQAIENAEADRALASQISAIRAQGQQAAYDKAIQAMQYGSNLGLQGLGGAQSGLGTALQGGQLGLSGIGQAMAGQQAGLAGLGQAGSLYGLGMQGSGVGLQGLQQQLAGTAQGMQGAQIGLSATDRANAAAQLALSGADRQLAGTAQGMQGAQIGLSAVDRANAAEQLALSGADRILAGTAQGMQGAQIGLQGVDRSLAGTAQGMQGAQIGLSATDRAIAAGQLAQQGFNTGLAGTAQAMQGAQIGLQGVDRQLAGTAQGMQGAQVGLQGVSGQQAGYGLANQAASNLSNIGTAQLGAQTGILSLQNQLGAQQQAREQQITNQAIQNFAQAQEAPMTAFNQYNALLRGYAMPGQTTTQYQAQANPLSQITGAGATLLAANNLTRGATGGRPKDFQKTKRSGLHTLALRNVLRG